MLDGVNIDTAQNVTINYDVASLGDRIVAYLIDGFIQMCYFIFLAIIFALTKEGESSGAIFILVVLATPFLFYHLISELTMNGQSIGKRARQIKVVKLDGSAPGFFNYFLRWILKPVDNFYGLGLLVLLLNGKGQRIGDLAAGTTVVRVQPRATLQDTLFTLVEENYQPRFPEVMRLTDEHIRLISGVLRHHETVVEMTSPILVATTQKVKAIMQVEPQMNDLGFLYTVVKDYNYYTQRTNH